MTWQRLDANWSLIEADLQDVGLDIGDRQLMRSRTWRWLEVRIAGLLSKPPLYDMEGRPRFTTRIQDELFTPPPEAQPGRTESR